MSLFFFLIMIAAAGLAIDMMRYEMERARIQQTLDAAVLAAAGSPFGSDGRKIVEDYFETAGMRQYLDDEVEGDIASSANASKVTANASMTLDTYLMKLSGVKKLEAKGTSTAERRVPKLEVALVLDVSGSMGNNNKLSNLQAAAKKFVTTILNSSEPGNTTVSIIPFSWDVAPGPEIFESLNVDVRQNYSTCLQFRASDFNSAAIDPEVQQTQLIYTAQDHYGFNNLQYSNRTCYTDEYAEILAYSSNETALHTKIDTLVASGNTSGNTGMKWGAALLDPKFKSVKKALDGKKDDDTYTSAVPAQYNEAETLKVIVMMGDGKNTYSNEFPFDSTFRGPNSYLHKIVYTVEEFQYAYHKYRHWYSDSESKCSKKNWECVYSSETKEAFYVYDDDDHEYDSTTTDDELTVWQFENLDSWLPGYVSTYNYSWEEAWGLMSPDFLNDETGFGVPEDVEFEGTGRVSGSEKDSRMSNICKATKDNGVVVYTIGFEISKGGTAEAGLKDCASSLAHYYRAEGVNINDAFSSIASNVVNLRLTE
ncbi:hypothetical protein K1T73_07235 [Roseovarius sp. SCSIO 43702]|nr:hypothetical protein K1T73_07235 [Roseovarius sp. SCSIO 43702]